MLAPGVAAGGRDGRRRAVGARLRAGPDAHAEPRPDRAVRGRRSVARRVVAVGLWTFRRCCAAWALNAWQQVGTSRARSVSAPASAPVAALASLALVLAWFEATPTAWDKRRDAAGASPLVVPALLLMAGLYTLALPLSLDGTRVGLAWVHLLVTLPYVFVALAPAWRSFDQRYEWTALALAAAAGPSGGT